MNRNDFNELNKILMKKCFEIMQQKGSDYTNENLDVLHNFKDIAKSIDLNPLQVWQVYFEKQKSAIYTFIKKGELKSETIESRIEDAINYLHLLYGLIKEIEDVKRTNI